MKPTERSFVEEIVFGKNAVLAYLERAAEAHPAAQPAQQLGKDQVREALARLAAHIGEQDEPLPDESELQRLSVHRINKILIASGARPDERVKRIHHLARQQKIPVQSCERRKLDQIAGPERRHQGVIALVSAAEMWRLETFLFRLELDRLKRELDGRSMNGYMVVVLDGIEDPHNLGAIIRVAEASGVRAVLIPQRRSAGLTSTVAKISAGALATLPVVRVLNLVQAIDTLKKYGFWVVGLDAGAPQLYTDADLTSPLVVVIGSEGQGMGRLVREHCDFLVRIPMLGKIESLNASVAAGIFFYEVVRQNKLSGY